MRDYSNRRDFGDTSNKQPLPYERKLKVRTSYYDHQFHNHHPLYPAQEHVPVPWINIKGYWLQEAGFNINAPLLVKVSKGEIVLTVSS
jgi:toxic protein SymE